MPVEIKLFKKLSVKNPTLIEGFPGIGLVGTVACNYLVEKLGMECVGIVSSDKFPPLATIHNFEPFFPTRLFESKKHNFLVLFSEFLIPLNVIYELSNCLLNFSAKIKAKKIISLAGISIMGEQDEVFGIANNKEDSELLKKTGVKLIREGASTGVNAMLLIEGKSKGIPVISLLAESKPGYIDPFAASLVLESLNRILNLKVDTTPLREESKRIEESMRNILERAKVSREHYSKTGESLGQTYI